MSGSARPCAPAVLILTFSCIASASAAPVSMISSSDLWRPMAFPNAATGDFNDLGNLGHDNLDVLGTTQYPGFYSHFDSADPNNTTDGTLSFRVRLGGDKQNDGGYVMVGVDANKDFVPDLFIGSNLQNAGSSVYALTATGGLTIASTILGPLVAPAGWAHTASNFSYAPVTAIDPSHPADIDGGDLNTGHGAEPDRYLSFSVPFSGVVSALAATLPPTPLDDTSLLSYTVFASISGNRVDQDLLGYGANFGDLTWAGASTALADVSGSVPEPDIIAAALITCSSMLLRKRQRPDRSEL